MKKHILSSITLACLFLTPLHLQANNAVDNFYTPDLYQKACNGKSVGAETNFRYKGVLWNGTCETQFFPTQKTEIFERFAKELNSVCKINPASKAINLKGIDFKGKCGLGYMAPAPK
jgi:hypothetical protein